MNWIGALLGVVVGAILTFGAQAFWFIQNARKERIWKMRDALADFGSAAYAYLDVQQNLAGLTQRQMNGRSPPTSHPLSEEDKLQMDILRERELAAGRSYYATRERLHACRSRLCVVSADKDLQARVEELWTRLDKLRPQRDVPRQTTDGTNPDFAAIEALRAEVHEWLAQAAAILPDKFR